MSAHAIYSRSRRRRCAMGCTIITACALTGSPPSHPTHPMTAHTTTLVRIQDARLAAQSTLLNDILRNLPRGVDTRNAGHPAAADFVPTPVPAAASLALTSPINLLLSLPAGILVGSLFLGAAVASSIPFIQNFPALGMPAVVIAAIVVSPFVAIGAIVAAIRSLLTGAAAVASTPAAATPNPVGVAPTVAGARPLPPRPRHRSSAGTAVPARTKPLSTAADKPGNLHTETNASKRDHQPRQHLHRAGSSKQRSAHAG